jgi:hypothetical protein
MSSSWGNPTWALFHTLANHVSEESFSKIKPGLIFTIMQICNHLPCPECSIHAKSFWRKTNVSAIHTKQDLINVLFVFHNCVNKRKRKAIFKFEDLSQYNHYNLLQVFNSFVRRFNTKGNMKMLADTFHRTQLLVRVKKWLVENIIHFNRAAHTPAPSPLPLELQRA